MTGGIPNCQGCGALFSEKPDYVLILSWNLRDEIAGQFAAVRDWGGRSVTAIADIRGG